MIVCGVVCGNCLGVALTPSLIWPYLKPNHASQVVRGSMYTSKVRVKVRVAFWVGFRFGVRGEGQGEDVHWRVGQAAEINTMLITG